MKLQFRPEAENDLLDIGAFIEKDSPRAAATFIAAVREKCEALTVNPEIGRARPELIAGLRSFPVGQYVIFYHPTHNSIEIVRVIHGARDIEAFF
ncbi:MAG: type II toxin-antitoxin system RelE/ParE family toxin [Alphaproteobacteria bacterium]|nr:type II toxin-antitoxin system RelE/ParE family toxin [Alphaproteobacteria bacterium]